MSIHEQLKEIALPEVAEESVPRNRVVRVSRTAKVVYLRPTSFSRQLRRSLPRLQQHRNAAAMRYLTHTCCAALEKSKLEVLDPSSLSTHWQHTSVFQMLSRKNWCADSWYVWKLLPSQAVFESALGNDRVLKKWVENLEPVSSFPRTTLVASRNEAHPCWTKAPHSSWLHPGLPKSSKYLVNI